MQLTENQASQGHFQQLSSASEYQLHMEEYQLHTVCDIDCSTSLLSLQKDAGPSLLRRLSGALDPGMALVPQNYSAQLQDLERDAHLS